MAYSITEYTTNGLLTEFNCVFPVIEKNDIVVKLDGITLNEGSDYEILNFVSFGDVCLISLNFTPDQDKVLTLQRFTDISNLKTKFKNGSILFLNDDLNKVNLQLLYSIQEADDRINNYVNRISGNNIMLQNLDMNNNRIVNLSDAINSNDAVNLGQVNQIFSSLTDLSVSNPFSGTGYQIGQTALSSNDLTINDNGFVFVDRTIDNYLDVTLYQELYNKTNYEVVGGFIFLPSILQFDSYNKYYTRVL